jgi:hypothetical protein
MFIYHVSIRCIIVDKLSSIHGPSYEINCRCDYGKKSNEKIEI